jgi:hypothetical protein
LKPFREKKTIFSLPMKLIWITTTCINCFSYFENPDSLHENSKNITSLFETINPYIKTVYVTYLTNVNIDNNVVDAIGVLKVSCKLIFFEEKRTHLEMILQQGINLSKLDKGCLIFNHKKKDIKY